MKRIVIALLICEVVHAVHGETTPLHVEERDTFDGVIYVSYVNRMTGEFSGEEHVELRPSADMATELIARVYCFGALIIENQDGFTMDYDDKSGGILQRFDDGDVHLSSVSYHHLLRNGVFIIRDGIPGNMLDKDVVEFGVKDKSVVGRYGKFRLDGFAEAWERCPPQD